MFIYCLHIKDNEIKIKIVARVIIETKEKTKTEETEEDLDNEFKNKLAIATSGLLPYYINPLKELELKSKENATTIVNYLLAICITSDTCNM